MAFCTNKQSESAWSVVILDEEKKPSISGHSYKYLCSEHFSEEFFKHRMGGRVYPECGSVPTRFSFTQKAKTKRKAPVDCSLPVNTGRVLDQLKTQSDSVKISPEEAVIFPSCESELPTRK